MDAPTQAILDNQLRQVPVLIQQANSQLATFPVGSSSGGFTYRFNPDLGTFSRSSESYGALLTERALTLGQGQFSFGTVYQHTSYDKYEDFSLKNPEIIFYYPHNDCCPGQSVVGVPGGDDSLLNPAFEGDVLENALVLAVVAFVELVIGPVSLKYVASEDAGERAMAASNASPTLPAWPPVWCSSSSSVTTTTSPTSIVDWRTNAISPSLRS
jgi:hypothetical protein